MSPFHINCTTPRIGQYICPPLNINITTQQPSNCSADNLATSLCGLIDGLACLPNTGFNETHFFKTDPCQYTTGYSFRIALFLSVFLGMFGADRLYLGYYAIGLLKFCTFGFMLVGQLVDIILIATQVLRPSDNSYYVIDYYGPKLDITEYHSGS